MFGAFSVPPVKVDDEGWEHYQRPIRIDSREAQFLYLEPETPEAAVAQFYASLIRGDDEYREVIPDRYDDFRKVIPTTDIDLITHKLRKLTSWTFLAVELRARRLRPQRRSWIRTYQSVLIEGRLIEQNQTVEVRERDGRWYVTRPPT